MKVANADGEAQYSSFYSALRSWSSDVALPKAIPRLLHSARGVAEGEGCGVDSFERVLG